MNMCADIIFQAHNVRGEYPGIFSRESPVQKTQLGFTCSNSFKDSRPSPFLSKDRNSFHKAGRFQAKGETQKVYDGHEKKHLFWKPMKTLQTKAVCG